MKNFLFKLKNIFKMQKTEVNMQQEPGVSQEEKQNMQIHTDLVRPLTLNPCTPTSCSPKDEEYKYESSIWFPYKAENGTYTLVGYTPSNRVEIHNFTSLDLLRIWSVLSGMVEIHGDEYNKKHNKHKISK